MWRAIYDPAHLNESPSRIDFIVLCWMGSLLFQDILVVVAIWTRGQLLNDPGRSDLVVHLFHIVGIITGSTLRRGTILSNPAYPSDPVLRDRLWFAMSVSLIWQLDRAAPVHQDKLRGWAQTHHDGRDDKARGMPRYSFSSRLST